MPENRQVVIASVPEGRLKAADFEIRAGAIPECGENQVLCRLLAVTIGAGQRAGLQGSASYAGAPVAGVVMGGTGVAQVEISRAEGFNPTDLVVAPTGWQDYSVHAAKSLRLVEPGTDPALHLGVFGTNGLTAYFGLLEVGQPQSGETVVVSAAAGSVGHIVGQIAKLRGCRTVGVAGSEEKCRVLVDELGF
ncbi:MAG: NADP-dependent oxidoreductase, partial [Anaerolineaceae bacterium]